jgi:tRNA pseudouridine13 synthase
MWIVKQRPEDFIVVERLSRRPAGSGDIHWYWMRKTGVGTVDVLRRLRRDFSLSKADYGIAGMKDKQAISYQWVSTSKWLGDTVSGDGFVLWHVGQDAEHVSRKWLSGNVFAVTVRGASEECCDAFKFFTSEGFANYYDYQRMASLRSGAAFRRLISGDYRGALWLLLTPSTRERVEDCFSRGDYRTCRKLARQPWERRVFDYLKRRPDDFRGALKHVSGDQRALHSLAYQSCMWNKVLSKLLERFGEGDRQWFEIDGCGRFVLVERCPRRWEIPFITWFLSEEWFDLSSDIRKAIEEVLEEENIDGLFALKTRLRGYTLVSGVRKSHVNPHLISCGTDSEGLRLVFELPMGAFATMYIRHAAMLCGDRLEFMG